MDFSKIDVSGITQDTWRNDIIGAQKDIGKTEYFDGLLSQLPSRITGVSFVETSGNFLWKSKTIDNTLQIKINPDYESWMKGDMLLAHEIRHHTSSLNAMSKRAVDLLKETAPDIWNDLVKKYDAGTA
jgi:hypothetical protein